MKDSTPRDIRALAVELGDRLAIAGFEPMRLVDAGAEALLLAAAADGYWPAEPVSPCDFYFALNRDVAKALDAARAIGVEPSIRAIKRGVESLGARGPHLERAIESLLLETPTVVHVDEPAQRVRALAWRRRMVAALDRLRALLVEPAIADADVEAAIDEFVVVGATQPKAEEDGGRVAYLKAGRAA